MTYFIDPITLRTQLVHEVQNSGHVEGEGEVAEWSEELQLRENWQKPKDPSFAFQPGQSFKIQAMLPSK